MIWSIIRLRAARLMLRLSRWLLDVGGKIVNDELSTGTDDAPSSQQKNAGGLKGG